MIHESNMLRLLPQPQSIAMHEGFFSVRDVTAILLEAGTSVADFATAMRLKQGLFSATGYDAEIIRLDANCTSRDLILRISPNDKNPESYKLMITPASVVVDGASAAGLRYGVETLLQIVNQAGIDLPSLEIYDTPDFLVRGLYHDVTRGQVPTLDTMKHIADLCVEYKMNHLEFYVEHCFLFRSMTEIGAGMDPLTAEEILELDRYCLERHIDLVPSISTFGHMYGVLSTHTFHHLGELDLDAGKVPFSWSNRQVHGTLDANNPDSIKLIERIFTEFLPLFSSDYVNICCDETFDLGKGKNQGMEPRELYIKHLLSVVKLVEDRGKRAMFWGDMVLEYDGLMDKLPANVVVLNWDYSSDPNEETSARFAETGLTQYLCPGVNAWSLFAQDITAAEPNIRHMAQHGLKYRASGLLNTNWGDYGHMNLLASSIHGIIMGAAYGWNVASTPEQSDFDESFSVVAYKDQSRTLGSLLRRLGGTDPYRFWITEAKPFNELRKIGIDDLHMDAATIRQNHGVALEIKRELEHLRAESAVYHRQDYDEFIWSASMIVAVNKYALLIIGEAIGVPEELASEFERLYNRYAQLWRRRNKESELFRIREVILQASRQIREYAG